MHYNSKHFLHCIWQEREKDDFPLTDRIIELLGNTFSRWHNSWYENPPFPSLPSLEAYLKDPARGKLSAEQQQEQLNASIAERKGLTIKYTLADLFSNADDTRGMDLFRIDPKEIIVGVLPPFTLGSGVVVMPYLREDERLNGFFRKLDETSMAGHTVPDYATALKTGIGRLLEETTAKLNSAGDRRPAQLLPVRRLCPGGCPGVFSQLRRPGKKDTRNRATGITGCGPHQSSSKLPHAWNGWPPSHPGGFIDALQMIFSIHCCMHLIGELVSIGRLDQLLGSFLDHDDISRQQAQEAIDCFWIKMDERC